MLPGPVFHVELIITARRARYYGLRVLYGLILLLVLWQTYESRLGWRRTTGRDQVSIREMAAFAHSVYFSFMTTQGLAVLFLTPALVAGVIADEKQRKTLHYLLASQLTSGEIVLGKLLARLLHVGVFLALGLPVMSLLTLFGGVDPEQVFAVTAGTLTIAFFLAGLSVYVSTIARRVRDAILAVYVLTLLWLVVPLFIEFGMKGEWPQIYALIGPINEWIYRSNPFGTLIDLDGPPGRRAAVAGMSAYGRVAWMLGLQLLAGAALTALAVWRLRPVYRSQGDYRGTLGRVFRQGRLRLWPRPACGEAPMLWKEFYIVRSGGLTRALMALAYVIGLVVLIYWAIYFGQPAFEELAEYGYGVTMRPGSRHRSEFNGFLRVVGTLLYALWGLGVAIAAAGSVTSEREEDTWVSLTTTDLTGGEILGAKMLGAIGSMRAIGVLMVLLWGLGVVSGAVHPLALPVVLLEVVVFTWFFAALGTTLSLRARSTTRALGATIGLILFFNVGYFMCCIPFEPDTPLILTGCTPAVQAISLFTYDEFWWILGFGPWLGRHRIEMVLACVLSVFGYGAAASILTCSSIAGFDAAIDRPRRPEGVGPSYDPHKVVRIKAIAKPDLEDDELEVS
ncbi:MAG: ABC transporter permease subunit [Isosphaeraceae bacterium]|nr:ABC transporter permease subunit [Isosphaeraceae bacterium]